MSTTLSQRLKNTIIEVPDFPKPGISFKDITPVLQDFELSRDLLNRMVEKARPLKPDVIMGLESRGFMFGFALAQRLGVGFIPIRKPGKLPRPVYAASYDLEYGSATLELHREDLKPNSRVIIHDDLLATGGTAEAASELVEKVGSKVVGYDFMIELEFLKGRSKLQPDVPLHCLLSY